MEKRLAEKDAVIAELRQDLSESVKEVISVQEYKLKLFEEKDLAINGLKRDLAETHKKLELLSGDDTDATILVLQSENKRLREDLKRFELGSEALTYEKIKLERMYHSLELDLASAKRLIWDMDNTDSVEREWLVEKVQHLTAVELADMEAIEALKEYVARLEADKAELAELVEKSSDKTRDLLEEAYSERHDYLDENESLRLEVDALRKKLAGPSDDLSWVDKISE
jgi:hypothetical protein